MKCKLGPPGVFVAKSVRCISCFPNYCCPSLAQCLGMRLCCPSLALRLGMRLCCPNLALRLGMRLCCPSLALRLGVRLCCPSLAQCLGMRLCCPQPSTTPGYETMLPLADNCTLNRKCWTIMANNMYTYCRMHVFAFLQQCNPIPVSTIYLYVH